MSDHHKLIKLSEHEQNNQCSLKKTHEKSQNL